MFGYSVFQFGVDITLPVLRNLVVWLDAADTLTVTETSGDITQWDDKSGNKHHATQGTGGLEPLYVLDQANGLPIVRFNGSSDILDLGSVVITGTVARTFFMLIRAESTAANDTVISLTNTSTSGERYDITSEPGLRVQGGNRLWTGDTITSPLSGTPEWFIITIGNAAVSNVTDTLGRNNGVVMTPTDATSEAITTGGGATTKLGQRSTGSGGYFDGDLGEVIMYDDLLSTPEIETMENYLAVKWGITLG